MEDTFDLSEPCFGGGTFPGANQARRLLNFRAPNLVTRELPTGGTNQLPSQTADPTSTNQTAAKPSQPTSQETAGGAGPGEGALGS